MTLADVDEHIRTFPNKDRHQVLWLNYRNSTRLWTFLECLAFSTQMMNPAGGMRLGYIGLLQWVKCWQFVHNLCCQWPRMVESPRRGCSSHFGTMLFAQKRWDCFGAEVMAVYSLQAIPTRTVSKRKSGTQATAG